MKTKSTTSRVRTGNLRLSTTRQRRQQHLLDVKVRARRASHYRNRRVLVVLSKVALVIAIIGAVYGGVRMGLSRFFFDNPDYRLTTIEIHTDGTLQRDQVLKTAGLREGLNIFSVSLAQVHDHLQQLPQVDDVQVERKMPNGIDVRITERKPIAWITSEKTVANPFISDAAFLVDARGIVMKEKKLIADYLALPLVTGVSSEALVPGKAVESFEAKAALELLHLTTTSFMQTRFQIREVDVSKGYCLLATDKNHIQVMFGFDNLQQQMQRLEQFLIYSDDSQRQIESVNLLVARNTPVTFARPAAEVIEEIEPSVTARDSSASVLENKTTPNEKKPALQEPEIRKAKPVAESEEKPARKALPYSPGVKKFHSNPSPPPVRRAIPLQRFNQGGNPNG